MKSSPVRLVPTARSDDAVVPIASLADQAYAQVKAMIFDFALLPGDHSLELSAKRLAPKMDAPVITSGSMMGAPPSPRGAASSEELPVVWASTSPLTMTCTVHEGRTVIIVGRIGTGNDWHAECQSVADIN